MSRCIDCQHMRTKLGAHKGVEAVGLAQMVKHGAGSCSQDGIGVYRSLEREWACQHFRPLPPTDSLFAEQ